MRCSISSDKILLQVSLQATDFTCSRIDAQVGSSRSFPTKLSCFALHQHTYEYSRGRSFFACESKLAALRAHPNLFTFTFQEIQNCNAQSTAAGGALNVPTWKQFPFQLGSVFSTSDWLLSPKELLALDESKAKRRRRDPQSIPHTCAVERALQVFVRQL